LKIAMFTDAYWPRVNGVTVSVDSFSRALVNEGHEVIIVCSSYPQNMNNSISLQKESEAENLFKIIKVPSIPAFVSKEDRIAKIEKRRWALKQVDSFNPDIIHINTEMVIAEFGFFYARSHNLPVIYTFHTMWEDYAPHYFPGIPAWFVKFIIRNLHKYILKRSYRVIVPTPQIETIVHKFKPNTITEMIPTGIELGLFAPDKEKSAAFRIQLEERFPALKGKRILLFAGRVAREKNLGFLLNILPDVLKKHPDAALVIAGNGPDQDYYKDEANKLGLTENCVFTGYFDRKELALVYSIAEIFTFPSLTDTQGLVTLEAMLSGTPVVAIGVLGTLTVMGGDNGGFMVKNDSEEFTARVLDLLGNPELYQVKAKEAMLHARSWSIEELTKKLILFYQAAIKDYKEDFGYRITPIWELLITKRWWNINRKILSKRTKKSWKKILSKLGIKK